jgi:hypothetical protein
MTDSTIPVGPDEGERNSVTYSSDEHPFIDSVDGGPPHRNATDSISSSPDLSRNLSTMLKQLIILGREIKEREKQERVIVAPPGLPMVVVTPPAGQKYGLENEEASVSPMDAEDCLNDTDMEIAHEDAGNVAINGKESCRCSSRLTPDLPQPVTAESSRIMKPSTLARHIDTLAIPDSRPQAASVVEVVTDSHQSDSTVQSAPSLTSMEAIDWDSLPLQPHSRLSRLRSLACF